jgi:hypothetical protein
MRALPVAATLFLGLTFGAAAQMLGPGMGFPGPPKPTGPGLSEALGTARGSTLDKSAPQSGALDTLTGNVLAR